MKSKSILGRYAIAAVVVLAGLLIWSAFPYRQTRGANPGFNKGDVFCATGNGEVRRFSPTGVLLQTLNSGTGSRNTTGMAFDCDGNLFSTQFDANSVAKFDVDGNFLGIFASGFNEHPESVVIDGAGNIYVGQPDGLKTIRKFNPAGTLIATISPPTGPRGTDWLDIDSDQTTLFYTSEGKEVRRFNLSTNTPLANFNTAPLPGANAYAFRILPNKQVLVADTETIVRLDASGAIIASYCAFFTSSGMSFLRVTIKNQGDATAAATTTAVAFGNTTVNVATPSLLPNQTVDLNVAVPTGGGPPVNLRISADVAGTLSERSNSNNVVTVSCP